MLLAVSTSPKQVMSINQWIPKMSLYAVANRLGSGMTMTVAYAKYQKMEKSALFFPFFQNFKKIRRC